MPVTDTDLVQTLLDDELITQDDAERAKSGTQ